MLGPPLLLRDLGGAGVARRQEEFGVEEREKKVGVGGRVLLGVDVGDEVWEKEDF